MLSALILLRHLAPAETAPATPAPPSTATQAAGTLATAPPITAEAPPLTDDQCRRAWALADFLQLYNPTELISGPGRGCADTLAPLATRLDLRVTVADDLRSETPRLPGAHAAVWLAARALRTLPDPRRTAVVCADSAVLSALLVAVAARDGHDHSLHDTPLPTEDPADLPPGGGWVLHRDDGRLVGVKPLAVR
ncbi:hypothetical protein [Glycomyces sp. NRRL B-16210]|uniref:hypothetical protein n=1 Tax=Glycomyces sp. NRRL B-16210 TaxID=1463821 RepID=UPI0004C268C1|nr:hypothetical protein [Glycomyces sp. NRRL B-16210]